MHPNWKCLSTVPLRFKPFVSESKYESQPQSVKNNAEDIAFKISTGSEGRTGSNTKHAYDEIVAEQYTPSLKNRIKLKIKSASVNKITKNSFNINSFMFSASNDDVMTMKNMLKECQEKINVCDDYGWSALMCAAHAGCVNTTKALLDFGADCSIKDKCGNNAISLALKMGHKNIADTIESYTSSLQQPPVNVIQTSNEFFCNSCQEKFKDSTPEQHKTSTVHLFNNKQYDHGTFYGIPMTNRGFQLMLRNGWNRETGLGPQGRGLKFPVKTVIRNGRSGLGTIQAQPRVSHYLPSTAYSIHGKCDITRKKNHIVNHYSERRKEKRLRQMLS